MRGLTRTGAKINSRIGKAIHDHEMVKNGDRILVGVSGGKDSLTLLSLLRKIQKWAPVKFEIAAAHITTDLNQPARGHENSLVRFVERLGIEYFCAHADVLDENGKTTCFWCSWNKRKCLFAMAGERSYNKIALAHHKDDIVETVLLNMLFKGEISAINPRQELFGGKMTLIRPLCYVEEDLIKAYAEESGFGPPPRICSFGDRSKRKLVKDLIADIKRQCPGTDIKTNVFNSVSRVRRDYIDVGKI